MGSFTIINNWCDVGEFDEESEFMWFGGIIVIFLIVIGINMSQERLKVTLLLGRQQKIAMVPAQRESTEIVILRGAHLLQELNQFIKETGYQISHHANVWVETGQWRRSLWALIGREDIGQVFAGERGDF